MGARQSEKKNQRGRRAAFQRQRFLHHRLSQRKLQRRGEKRFRPGQNSRQRRQTRREIRKPKPRKWKKNEDDVASASRFNDSTIQRFRDPSRFYSLRPVFSCRLRAQIFRCPTKFQRAAFPASSSSPASDAVSALAASPAVATNTNFVRLEPALLAVSAERIKQSLWRELELKPDAPWRGKIFLALHPAQSLDENVTIVSTPSANGWNYQVELPDVLPRTRFARALISTLLLEFANRSAQSHSAEIPAWLADGLSQQLLADNSSEIILSSPDKLINGLAQNRMVATESGIDPLAGARRVLRNSPALTFDQLSWPTDAQLMRRRRRRVSRQRAVVCERTARSEKWPGAFARDAPKTAAVLQLADGLSNRVPRRFSAAARRGKMVGVASRRILPRAIPARNGRPPSAAKSSTKS